MATPLSRLKSLSVKKEIWSYEHLERYVYTYCGATLRKAVKQYEHQMREFYEVRRVSEPACGMQRGFERTMPRKRGLGGCSMVIERRLKE